MGPRGKNHKPLPKEEVKKRLNERKKESKQKLKEKRARLIVKNLPFKVTPEKLKEYFEQYGEVKSVELLKKDDGKLKGCGFVQFNLVQKAAKARHHTNGKEFLGRPITVDFAIAKKQYEKKKNVEDNKEIVEIKDEKDDGTEGIKEEIIEIKEEKNDDFLEDDDDNSVDVDSIKSEIDSDDEEIKDSESDLGTDNDEEEVISEEKTEITEGRNPHISNDVSEGKTVFVKNVPFNATNDDLKQCMKQFGPVYYALICIDKLTEHSRGTAFVKFVNKEDADTALNAGTELKLLGNILDCHPALDKNAVNRKIYDDKESKKQPKDSRNLYLVKEGVILAGSPAAVGVSASDMGKRLQIEQYKTQMLRNLKMYVSRERLIVHNLPSTWDDKKLRTLFIKFAGPGAVIKECKIMRDLKNVDAKGVGLSKEYGFVSFTKHENALMALRNLNNNPEIFSENKRPIISFSIENKAIIKAREKRLEKSRQYNPKSKTYNPEDKTTITEKRKGKITRKDFKQKRKIENSNENSDIPKYSGVATKPGVKEKMRSRYKLTTQAKLHHENLKKEKKRKKNAKKTLAEKRKDFIKQPKQKINQKSERDNFTKLVNDYKKKLVNVPIGKKSKWYE